MKPFGVFDDFGLLQSGDLGVRTASNRNENFFEDLLGGLAFLGLELHTNAIRFFFQPGNGGVQHDGREDLFNPLRQRIHQVAIGSRQQAWQHFDHGHFGPERGIDSAKLQPDVAAADDEQASSEYLAGRARPSSRGCAGY